ncbi:MAG: TetR/AcrR family transcriptional regulator [Chloroflexota bacterium]
MNKGQATREYIIAKSAPLFNEKGYSGSSMSDIMTATGLKKGGIYNHFASKDEIALAAFDYNWSLLRAKYEHALQAADDSATAQLYAAINTHANIASDPAMAGGCPLLNTAIENDDGHPLLRARVRAAVDFWHNLLEGIASRGIVEGDFKSTLNPKEVATVIISTLEGGIMLSKLYQTLDHIHIATEHLRAYVEANVVV